MLTSAVALVIVYTAIRRLIDPPEVRGGTVLAVALVRQGGAPAVRR